MLGSIKEIPVDIRNGQGEPNKNFMVTLLIMDEDSTIHPITASKKNLEEHINENETKMKKCLDQSEILLDMWNGQGEPNKDFVVTLLIMDEDGTIHPITAFKKNLEEHINENETKRRNAWIKQRF